MNAYQIQLHETEDKYFIVLNGAGGNGQSVELPENLATTDKMVSNVRLEGNVYTKDQVNHLMLQGALGATGFYTTTDSIDEFKQALPEKWRAETKNLIVTEATNGKGLLYLYENGEYFAISIDDSLFIKKLLPEHPNASKLLKGDGTYTDLPDLSTKADKSAENLEDDDVERWREKLEIIDPPVLDFEPEITAGEVIKFDKLRDYGNTAPLSTFSLDLADAKRGNVQYVYFNGQTLPSIPQLKWVNKVNEYFQAGNNYLIEIEYKDNNNVLANLLEYNA